jgi:DNA-binding XRE family transcriptional regulator
MVLKKHVNTKKNTDNLIFSILCPMSNVSNIQQYLKKHGCVLIDDNQKLLDAKGLFAKHTPQNMLIGARGKENLTQEKLSELTGIPRRHISDMENGRRPIGKQNALKLGKAMNINYRLFL